MMVAVLVASLASVSCAWAQESGATTFQVTGYHVTGDLPVEIKNIDALLATYTGEHNNTEGLQEAADTLEKKIHERGYTFVRVVIPRQPLDDGDIELRVVSFMLDKINISGNVHFGEDNIRASLPHLVQGKTPNMRSLARNLDAGRIHPARKSKITFVASADPGKLDANVQVSDRKPSSFFSWLPKRFFIFN